ncbi:hypothetical protein [Acidianus manzaensis]|uniref:Uncharacterized protein n=1 Tax=Acidianus manzaensis TaxID=282676 RepID=A0A1W6JZ56_9CREN|nr:hypothetical protein [Acidianus manzaensis]ARM75500.1 hypothetical protein B6F84_05270 [Acidianus manzaensis]
MVSYTYCVEQNGDKVYLTPGKECHGVYYIFEYTKDMQLLVSRCINHNCMPIDDISTINLKFKDEPEYLNEILSKINNIRQFLNKYNIKIYFLLKDTSVLEAIYSPLTYYYKYLGINDPEFRDKELNYLKEWSQRLLLLVKLVESIGVKKFTSHLDSLDGRYALWIGSNDPVVSFITNNDKEITLWLLYNGCEIFLKEQNIEICVEKDKLIFNGNKFNFENMDTILHKIL